MTAYSLIAQNLAYHQWANHTLIQWLKTHPRDLYHKEVVSSFTTLNQLMHHILNAEKYYLSILRQTTVQYEKEMTTEEIFTQLLETDQVLVGWFSHQESTVVEQTVQFKRSPYVETYTVAALLTHIVNHTTYHRGQLVALRPQLGLSAPPQTDYYRYFIPEEIRKEMANRVRK